MATGRENTQLGLSTGEDTASGSKFLMDDEHVIFDEVIILAATRDSKRTPTTVLEPGLALKKGTGGYTHVTNGTDTTSARRILHNNNLPLNIARGQQRARTVLHGYVDRANVRDTSGTAID